MVALIQQEYANSDLSIKQTTLSDLPNDSINYIMSYIPYRNWHDENPEEGNIQDNDTFKGGLAALRLVNKKMDSEIEKSERGQKARAANSLEPHWLKSNAADYGDSIFHMPLYN